MYYLSNIYRLSIDYLYTTVSIYCVLFTIYRLSIYHLWTIYILYIVYILSMYYRCTIYYHNYIFALKIRLQKKTKQAFATQPLPAAATRFGSPCTAVERWRCPRNHKCCGQKGKHQRLKSHGKNHECLQWRFFQRKIIIELNGGQKPFGNLYIWKMEEDVHPKLVTRVDIEKSSLTQLYTEYPQDFVWGVTGL